MGTEAKKTTIVRVQKGSSSVPTFVPNMGTVGTTVPSQPCMGTAVGTTMGHHPADTKELSRTVPSVPAVPVYGSGFENAERCDSEVLLEQRIKSFATALTNEYGGIPHLRDIAPKVLKHSLPKRRPGRPPLDDVSAAIALRAEQRPWKGIYPAVIPNYADLASELRGAKQRELRDRVRNRLYTQRQRSS